METNLNSIQEQIKVSENVISLYETYCEKIERKAFRQERSLHNFEKQLIKRYESFIRIHTEKKKRLKSKQLNIQQFEPTKQEIREALQRHFKN
ncbi:hypothetical protein MY04_1117 [Flammeovirga sp. MY04]|uniref:hypothetical protein n=1 Tax=Flammeovirga sp. MY04 TaxID=1191459 RepID=UPI0008062877|nr:hypothetical protein [Flammeovirga sp. MY04]ANQ48494.1 hypothetical protein MY04_1117 [Flammeovirga sp. MY04]